MRAAGWLVILTSVGLGGDAWAQGTVPHVFSANTPARAAEVNENFAFLAGQLSKPRVYFTQACHPDDCILAAGSVDYSPPDRSTVYTTLASLDLPQGNWVVTAKLSAWNPGNAWFVLECGLQETASDQGDWASATLNVSNSGGAPTISAQAQHSLHMLAPVTYASASSGGTMVLKCRVVGQTYVATQPATPTAMHIWGAQITAIEVGAITKR